MFECVPGGPKTLQNCMQIQCKRQQFVLNHKKNNENCVLLMRSEPKCIDFIRLCYIFYNLEAPAEGLEANALGFCPGGVSKGGRTEVKDEGADTGWVLSWVPLPGFCPGGGFVLGGGGYAHMMWLLIEALGKASDCAIRAYGTHATTLSDLELCAHTRTYALHIYTHIRAHTLCAAMRAYAHIGIWSLYAHTRISCISSVSSIPFFRVYKYI